jgi:opacity protein-like surface antigen
MQLRHSAQLVHLPEMWLPHNQGQRKEQKQMSRKVFAALNFGVLLMSVSVFAQEDYTRLKSEVSAQATGSFVKSTTDNGVPQSTTNSAGVLGTYRFYFNRHSGVEVNYAFTQNTERYGVVSISGIPGSGIDTNSHEVTAAYIFRLPRKRWSPFVLAGVGGLIFDPTNFAGASQQARAAFLYGGGADFNLSDHLFVRAQYRGLVYTSPTYDASELNGFDRTTHRAEPTIGFGWRF